MADRRSDADIIRESLEDPQRFGVLFDRHARRVYSFAAKRIGAQQAEDVVSDVFVTAFRIRLRYDLGRPNAVPWLLSIAANTIGGALRSKRRRDRLYIAIPAERPAVFDESAVADRIDFERIGVAVNKALGRLSARDRDAFLLQALDNLTYSEIGAILGIPAGTVGSRINRARRKLREGLADLETILSWMDEERGGGLG